MVPVTTNQTCKKPTRHECGPKTCGVNLNEDVDFQPPRKTGEIWPTKKNTYVVSSWQNSSIWVCLTVFWGGKKNTCSSLKHLLKKQPKKKSVQAAKIMAQDHCSAMIFSCTWRWLKARPKVLLHLGSVSHNWSCALLGLMGWTWCYWWPLRE